MVSTRRSAVGPEPAPVVKAAEQVRRSERIKVKPATVVQESPHVIKNAAVPSKTEQTSTTSGLPPSDWTQLSKRDAKNHMAETYTRKQRDRVIFKIGHYEKYTKSVRRVIDRTVTVGDCSVFRDSQGTLQLAWTRHLPSGGVVTIYPGFIDPEGSDSDELVEEIKENKEKIFRQYHIQAGDEPRVHGLLSCDDPVEKANCPSYSYHNVKMKAQEHISMFPALQAVSVRAAEAAKVDKWKIGCDVILYRNGLDRIGWHGDDTQGETCIFCIVVQSEGVRPLQVRTQKTTAREQDDEYYEILAAQGDAYEMDEIMQHNYEHRVPPNQKKGDHLTKNRRTALIFRDGQKEFASEDGGSEVSNFDGKRQLTREETDPVGALPGILQEGHVYSRTYLLKNHAVSNVQGGVSGVKDYGCSAIIVSRQRKKLRESDHFGIIYYSSNGIQRGQALFHSIGKGNPVRVFRSSNLNNPFRPCNPGKKKSQSAIYRYDGLYQVVSCFYIRKNGSRHENPPVGPEGAKKDVLYTFKLVRLSTSVNELDAQTLLDLSLEMGTVQYPKGGWDIEDAEEETIDPTALKKNKKRRTILTVESGSTISKAIDGQANNHPRKKPRRGSGATNDRPLLTGNRQSLRILGLQLHARDNVFEFEEMPPIAAATALSLVTQTAEV